MTYKILIVDDSKLARMAVAKALNGLQPAWTRLEASNAEEALKFVAEADVAVLDFNMPGKDGLALAAEIHELRPQMPLAIVSANYQDEIVARAREVGAVFLPKPVTDKALADFIQQADSLLQAAQR